MLVNDATRQYELVRDTAASIGSQVHAYAELFAQEVIAKRDVPPIPEEADGKVRAGINAFLQWFVQNDVRFIDTEILLYSQKHKYAGITDVVANVNGKRTLIDYKTSSGIYPEMSIQLAAYQHAFEEQEDCKLDQRMIVNFSKDTGEFTNRILDSRKDFKKDMKAFVGLLAAKRRLRELEK